MARECVRILDAVIAGDHDLAWREMGHHFTLNQRIARRIARHQHMQPSPPERFRRASVNRRRLSVSGARVRPGRCHGRSKIMM